MYGSAIPRAMMSKHPGPQSPPEISVMMVIRLCPEGDIAYKFSGASLPITILAPVLTLSVVSDSAKFWV